VFPKRSDTYLTNEVIGLIFVSMCVIILLGLVSDNVRADESDLEISFNDRSKSSNSSTHRINQVTFTGYVRISNNSTISSVHVLNSLPNGWTITCNKSVFLSQVDLNHSFSIGVYVPSRSVTGLHTINVTFIIRGESFIQHKYYDLFVWVNQYYGLEIMPIGNSFIVTNRGTFEGALKITNRGNGEDSFRIKMYDDYGLIMEEDLPESITIPQNTSVIIPYNMRIIFQNSSQEWYEIVIDIRSIGKEQNQSAIFSTTQSYTIILLKQSPSTHDVDYPIQSILIVLILSLCIVLILNVYFYWNRR
jgi:hypothetical protein